MSDATERRVVVTGAGGFIGHHLVKYLVARGYWVRGVDLKRPEFEPSPAHEFRLLDLRRWEDARAGSSSRRPRACTRCTASGSPT